MTINFNKLRLKTFAITILKNFFIESGFLTLSNNFNNPCCNPLCTTTSFKAVSFSPAWLTLSRFLSKISKFPSLNRAKSSSNFSNLKGVLKRVRKKQVGNTLKIFSNPNQKSKSSKIKWYYWWHVSRELF